MNMQKLMNGIEEVLEFHSSNGDNWKRRIEVGIYHANGLLSIAERPKVSLNSYTIMASSTWYASLWNGVRINKFIQEIGDGVVRRMRHFIELQRASFNMDFNDGSDASVLLNNIYWSFQWRRGDEFATYQPKKKTQWEWAIPEKLNFLLASHMTSINL